MQHANWKAQARMHWKEHRPKAYREMVRKGTLEQALTTAAEETSKEMQMLIDQGATRDEAWEMVRETHLFKPEEPGASEQAPASPGYQAMAQYHRAASKLNR